MYRINNKVNLEKEKWLQRKRSDLMTMSSRLLLELVFYIWLIRVGSFGRVRLARNKKTGEYFAMKILKKADIIKLKQVDHVISENTILADIEHPFLVTLRIII